MGPKLFWIIRANSWIIPAFKLRMVPLVIPGLQGIAKFILPEFVKTFLAFMVQC